MAGYEKFFSKYFVGIISYFTFYMKLNAVTQIQCSWLS